MVRRQIRGDTMRATIALAAAMLLAGCGSKEESKAPMTPAEQGRKAFSACGVCHTVTDPEVDKMRLIGPSLYRIYEARSAREAGYDYSPALKNASLVWDESTLDAFIERPQSVVPGTRMAFAGESDPAKRAALIAYLKTLR